MRGRCPRPLDECAVGGQTSGSPPPFIRKNRGWAASLCTARSAHHDRGEPLAPSDLAQRRLCEFPLEFSRGVQTRARRRSGVLRPERRTSLRAREPSPCSPQSGESRGNPGTACLSHILQPPGKRPRSRLYLAQRLDRRPLRFRARLVATTWNGAPAGSYRRPAGVQCASPPARTALGAPGGSPPGSHRPADRAGRT